MPKPKAVLLDVGGVFLVPEHDRIIGACARGGFTVSGEILDEAHYRGARSFPMNEDVEWPRAWGQYLDGYVTACGVPDELRAYVHQHLDSEFADAALWLCEFPGARDGLAALAQTGVRLGVISNADGLIGQRLADLGVLQVGPGAGIEVECVIDSGNVGVMKPDPRIFHLAPDAM